MDKKFLKTILIEAGVGFGLTLLTWYSASIGSHYETWGLEYLLPALTFLVTIGILFITIVVGSVRAIIRGKNQTQIYPEVPLAPSRWSPRLIPLIVLIVVLIVPGAGIWYWHNWQSQNASQEYRNDPFGFSIALPDSWKGYTVNRIKEDIYDVSGKITINNGVVDSFQIVELHHPLETAQNSREDMPIFIFTPAQWDHIQKEEWSVGAAPISPSVLGQNSKYVLALPARYNYDYKTGWEEVDQLVHGLKSFEPSNIKTGTGTLTGHVTIGPICPVEQEGVSCTPSPEVYASREFVVLNGNGKEVTLFRADASGSYSISLLPGTYTVVSAKTGFGSMSKDLPKTVIIKKGETVNLNIDIDTGIR